MLGLSVYKDSISCALLLVLTSRYVSNTSAHQSLIITDYTWPAVISLLTIRLSVNADVCLLIWGRVRSRSSKSRFAIGAVQKLVHGEKWENGRIVPVTALLCT